METRLIKLKGDFNNIITIRTNVKNVFDILQVRIDKLHQIYSEFIKNNKNDMFVFGLDTFHFQSKLIDIEYDDMKRLFLAINNRMYCEYFKLHKIIVDYISKNINDRKSIDLIKINNYPAYKDLEPFKEYKFELILDVHENILNLLGVIISILNNKENELSIHKTKQTIGLNIDNFITTFNFNLNVMREKIIMFITYIEFFHKMHTKYLKRFSNKIQLIYTHINNDIKFDDTIEVSKNKKRELIDELISSDIDKDLLKDIKTSIGSETNSENSSEGSKSNLNSPLSIPFMNSQINLISPDKKFQSEKLSVSTISTLLDNSQNEKKNLRNIFKKNIHKVTNMLQLCKPRLDKIQDPEMSNSDLDNIFNGINKSCDSIIDNNDNNVNNNIGLNIEFLDEKDNKNTLLSHDIDNEEKSDFKPIYFKLQNPDIHDISKDIEENIILDNNELVVEEEKVDEEEKVIEEKVDEEVKMTEEKTDEEEKIIEEVKTEQSEEKHDEPAAKKKRTYNRKKKV